MTLDLFRFQTQFFIELRDRYAAAILHLDNTILIRSADHPTHDAFLLEFRMVSKWETNIHDAVEDAIELMTKSVQRAELGTRNGFRKKLVPARNTEQVVSIWRKAFEDITSIQNKRQFIVNININRIREAVCKYLPNACEEVSQDLEESRLEIESYVEEMLIELVRLVTSNLNEISKINENSQ